MVIVNPVNDATPLIAATVLVPPIVPLPVATDRVTLDVLLVTTFPYWSSIETWIVPNVPAVAFPGCCVNTRCVADAALTVKLEDVSAVKPPSLTPSV